MTELTASGLTPAADATRGPLAGTTPVVTYFSFGHGQRDPQSGQKLLDHYVTIVAPTYGECRDAMFASRFGREWSFDYLAGDPKNTEWIRRWTEHEVIVAPGVDTEAANWALAQALRVLDGRELEPWESNASLADRVAESMEPMPTCPTCGKPHDHVHACAVCGRAEIDDGKPFVPCCQVSEAGVKAARELLDRSE